MKREINVCWLRRDLRLHDNRALFEALRRELPVLLVFIFDIDILKTLSDPRDSRVEFIHKNLQKIQTDIEALGSSLKIYHGTPRKAFEELISKFSVKNVFLNHDYEPYARKRDKEVADFLSEKGVILESFKDQVIFEKADVLKPNGTPYTVFTPYSKRWKHKLHDSSLPVFPSEDLLHNLLKLPLQKFPSLEEIGFRPGGITVPSPDFSEKLIINYQKTRDIPAVLGTTQAGVHLRFGTVSVRQLVRLALQQCEVWLNELIWREFFMMILFHFPEVENNNFRSKYDRLQWRNNEAEFQLWCKGETGYPMVDAGMRQLNETGWMHNRVRMVVAGFLTKHLLIDWRWGEAYFAQKLLDYELASNNGNWQWAAGTGCDSAPYFRIFNPSAQLKKFDPNLEYVKTWVRDYAADYLPPVVDHAFARARALEAYRKALNN